MSERLWSKFLDAEVGERFWAKISASDGDADGRVSLDELAAFKAERQADPVDAEPNQSGERLHHHRTHQRSFDEVFAAIGRAFGRR